MKKIWTLRSNLRARFGVCLFVLVVVFASISGFTSPINIPAPVSAVRESTRILLNAPEWELEFNVEGYTWNDRIYFRLDDIAFMLNQTQAQFSFTETAWYARGTFIHRGRPMNPAHGWPPGIEGETARHGRVFMETRMEADILTGWMDALTVGQAKYFALEDLSDFLGFTIDMASNDIISINTNEPSISEYGRKVAEAFLSQHLTLFGGDENLFNWDEITLGSVTPRYFLQGDGTELGMYPHRFILYDFNNNGIPDILIQYDVFPGAMRRMLDLYIYAVIYAESKTSTK